MNSIHDILTHIPSIKLTLILRLYFITYQIFEFLCFQIRHFLEIVAIDYLWETEFFIVLWWNLRDAP